VVGNQFGADRIGRHIPFLYRDSLRGLADGNAMVFAGAQCLAVRKAQRLCDLICCEIEFLLVAGSGIGDHDDSHDPQDEYYDREFQQAEASLLVMFYNLEIISETHTGSN
jgi:hypothetical protein